MQHRIKKR